MNTRGKRPSLVGLGEWDEAVDRFKTAIQLFEALEARRLSPLAASPVPAPPKASPSPPGQAAQHRQVAGRGLDAAKD